jgi:hypothetical protein
MTKLEGVTDPRDVSLGAAKPWHREVSQVPSVLQVVILQFGDGSRLEPTLDGRTLVRAVVVHDEVKVQLGPLIATTLHWPV